MIKKRKLNIAECITSRKASIVKETLVSAMCIYWGHKCKVYFTLWIMIKTCLKILICYLSFQTFFLLLYLNKHAIISIYLFVSC